MRLRYPHIVEGAIAASAPFKWLTGEEGLHPFFESIKEVQFLNSSSVIKPVLILIDIFQCKRIMYSCYPGRVFRDS